MMSIVEIKNMKTELMQLPYKMRNSKSLKISKNIFEK